MLKARPRRACQKQTHPSDIPTVCRATGCLQIPVKSRGGGTLSDSGLPWLCLPSYTVTGACQGEGVTPSPGCGEDGHSNPETQPSQINDSEREIHGVMRKAGVARLHLCRAVIDETEPRSSDPAIGNTNTLAQ